MKLVLVLVAGFVGMIAIVAVSSYVLDGPAVAAKPVVTIDKSEAMQAERKAFIAKLQEQGFITEISMTSDGRVPNVLVRPSFLEGDFKDKERIMAVVYAYYYDGTKTTDFVRIRDARTNNEIGTYTPVRGLDLD